MLMEDPLPAGVDFVSASASQGTCTGTSTVSCTLGKIANGARATVTIVVKPTSAGALSNTATVTSASDDANASNNSDTEATTVQDKIAITADCNGTLATIVAEPGVPTVGTAGRDVIVGTDGADVIKGLAATTRSAARAVTTWCSPETATTPSAAMQAPTRSTAAKDGPALRRGRRRPDRRRSRRRSPAR